MASLYRVKAMKALDGEVKIPTQIADDADIRINHVSKILSELKAKEMIECINEDQKKGRLYHLTSIGDEIVDKLE